MAKFMVLAFTNPIEGKEDEYNDYYDNVAMPVYRGVPNTKVLGRYKALDMKSYEFAMDNQWKYVSLYEIEADNIDDHFKEVWAYIEKAKAEGRYQFNEFIDKSTAFEPVFVKMVE
jgi:hypothetical protein